VLRAVATWLRQVPLGNAVRPAAADDPLVGATTS